MQLFAKDNFNEELGPKIGPNSFVKVASGVFIVYPRLAIIRSNSSAEFLLYTRGLPLFDPTSFVKATGDVFYCNIHVSGVFNLWVLSLIMSRLI